MYWPSAASTLLWYKHGTEHGFVYIDWCFILLLLYGVEQWHSWTQQKKLLVMITVTTMMKVVKRTIMVIVIMVMMMMVMMSLPIYLFIHLFIYPLVKVQSKYIRN